MKKRNNYAFVSYSHLDSEKVLPIIDALKKAGYHIWYDKDKLKTGDKYTKKIVNNLMDASVVIAFFSQNFLDSKYCYFEMGIAQQAHREVIPIFLEMVKTPEKDSVWKYCTTEQGFLYMGTPAAAIKHLSQSTAFQFCHESNDARARSESKEKELQEKTVNRRPRKAPTKLLVTLGALVLVAAIAVGSWLWFFRSPNLNKKAALYEEGFNGTTTSLSAAEIDAHLTVDDKALIQSGEYNISYATKTATTSYGEWFTMGANDDILFPGALVDLSEPTVKPLVHDGLKRSSVMLSTNMETVLVDSYETKTLYKSAEPQLHTVRQAIRDIVNENMTGVSALPSNITMTMHEIQSKEEFAMNLGLGLSAGPIDFAEQFDLDMAVKQTNLVVVFKQVYYSVDCSYPGINGFFAAGTSNTQIENALKETVPAYVSSVDYGRIVVMAIQTNYSKQEVMNALSAGYNTHGIKFLTDIGIGNGINLEWNLQRLAEDDSTTITYFEYGGSEKNTDIVTKSFAGEEGELSDIFSASHNPNAALPISYTIRHLDGSLARIEDQKTYTVKNVEYIPKKLMKLDMLKTIFSELRPAQTYLTIDLSKMINYDGVAGGNNEDFLKADYTIVLPAQIKNFTLIGANGLAAETVFKNLSILIKSPTTLVLNNISFAAQPGLAAIYTGKNMHDFTVRVLGEVGIYGSDGVAGNEAGKSAVSVDGSVDFEICTDADLVVKGGNGMVGYSGGTGIYATRDVKLLADEYTSVEIIGGNGGNAVANTGLLDGAAGNKGCDGAYGMEYGSLALDSLNNLPLHYSTITIRGGNGGNGSDGNQGVTGKQGENNGAWFGTAGAGAIGGILVNAGNVTLCGGTGGAGGRGGRGGTGGQGGSASGASSTTGNGGRGGTGGRGGNGGVGGATHNSYNTSVNEAQASLQLDFSAWGKAGQGGLGGEGGAAGQKFDLCSSSGSKGAVGESGHPGQPTQDILG